ncbi:hypothetical protein BC829DRAFT_66441 [Chytridium lagenaria]|nr:hypothetical protein BC829DRAFT_66441 [Chytridium lagenaria]
MAVVDRNNVTERIEVNRLCSIGAFENNIVYHAPKRWLQIAVTAMNMNQNSLFEWIINTRRTPVLGIVSPGTRSNLLHEAVRNRRSETVKFLLKHPMASSLLLHKNVHGKIPLELAIWEGDANIIKLFENHMHKMLQISKSQHNWRTVQNMLVDASLSRLLCQSWWLICGNRFAFIS